ncbi:MAG: hypothetical protein ACUVWX_15085 [Kiritimatiellia bacterium]
MKQICLALVALLAVFLALGCGARKSKIPEELQTLSNQFRSLAGKDRMEVGKRIRELLPTTVSRSAPNGALSLAMAKPSYYLNQKEIAELLGQPDELYEGDFYYRLGEDEKYRYGLLVQFDNDHVMLARLDVEDKRIKRRK